MSRTRFSTLGLVIAAVQFGASVASAGQAWEEIRASVFGQRAILDGRGFVSLEAPTRPNDMRVVPIAVTATLARGSSVKRVTLLIDDNPTPVVADFTFGPGRDRVSVAGNFRVDRQSEVRAIVEAADGELYMVSRLVKFAGGQSSCSAPPTGDPAEIAATMGQMSLQTAVGLPVSEAVPKATLNLRHPNHTGMVMDQQTLLYTPMKMVSEIEVRQGSDLVFAAIGSIALSQDPSLTFDFVRNGAADLTVTFKDTDGGHWTRSFPVGPQS